MHLTRLALAGVMPILLASAANAQFVDDFADGTNMGWNGDGPMVIMGGGADGAADPYLQVSATGGGGPGSKMAMFNDEARWTTDFNNPIFNLSVLFDDPNASINTLELRAVIFAGDGSRWTSTDAVMIGRSSDWQTASFEIAEPFMSRVAGSATFDTTIDTMTRVMFRHDAGGPSAGGTTTNAIVGFDNLYTSPLPEPAALSLLGIAGLGLLRRRA